VGVLDQPTEPPDSTVVEFVIDDGDEPLTEAERAAINAGISRAWQQAEAGELEPAAEVLARLRARRREA